MKPSCWVKLPNQGEYYETTWTWLTLKINSEHMIAGVIALLVTAWHSKARAVQTFRDNCHDNLSPFSSHAHEELKEARVIHGELEHLDFAPRYVRYMVTAYTLLPKIFLVVLVPLTFDRPSLTMMGYLGFVLGFLSYEARFIHNIEAGKATDEADMTSSTQPARDEADVDNHSVVSPGLTLEQKQLRELGLPYADGNGNVIGSRVTYTWWQIFRCYNLFVLAASAFIEGYCKLSGDEGLCHHEQGLDATFLRNLHQTSISTSKSGIDVPYFDIFVFVASLALNELFMSRKLRRVLRSNLAVEPARAKPIRTKVDEIIRREEDEAKQKTWDERRQRLLRLVEARESLVSHKARAARRASNQGADTPEALGVVGSSPSVEFHRGRAETSSAAGMSEDAGVVKRSRRRHATKGAVAGEKADGEEGTDCRLEFLVHPKERGVHSSSGRKVNMGLIKTSFSELIHAWDVAVSNMPISMTVETPAQIMESLTSYKDVDESVSLEFTDTFWKNPTPEHVVIKRCKALCRALNAQTKDEARRCVAFGVNPLHGVQFYNKHCKDFQGRLECNKDTHKWTTYELPVRHTRYEAAQEFLTNAGLTVLMFLVQVFEALYSLDGRLWRAVEREEAPKEHARYLMGKYECMCELMGLDEDGFAAELRMSGHLRDAGGDQKQLHELIRTMRVEISDTVLASIQSRVHLEETKTFLRKHISKDHRGFIEGLLLHQLGIDERDYYLDGLSDDGLEEERERAMAQLARYEDYEQAEKTKEVNGTFGRHAPPH